MAMAAKCIRCSAELFRLYGEELQNTDTSEIYRWKSFTWTMAHNARMEKLLTAYYPKYNIDSIADLFILFAASSKIITIISLGVPQSQDCSKREQTSRTLVASQGLLMYIFFSIQLLLTAFMTCYSVLWKTFFKNSKTFPRSTEWGGLYRSWGFEGEDSGNSPGWWDATVATYCPTKPGELPKSSSSKPHDW